MIWPLSLSVKNPSPEIARSSDRSVRSVPPCPNSCMTLARRTPLPISCAPTANTAASWARELLNPTVFAFAMLLAVTLRSAEAAFNPLKAILNGMSFSLSASADFPNCAERRLAEHAEVQRQAARAERHAFDGRADERLGALHLVAVAELRGHGVASGRRALAGIRFAVPAKAHCAGLLRAEVDLPHELAGRIADLHLHRGGAPRKLDAGLDPFVAERHVLRAHQHVPPDQPRRLERLIRDERLG